MIRMQPQKGLDPDEIDMLEALGMQLAIQGEILTVSFPKTGYREEWIASELPIEKLVGRDTLTIGGTLYVLIDTVRS